MGKGCNGGRRVSAAEGIRASLAKAEPRDRDGDGKVFDGTPQERPVAGGGSAHSAGKYAAGAAVGGLAALGAFAAARRGMLGQKARVATGSVQSFADGVVSGVRSGYRGDTLHAGSAGERAGERALKDTSSGGISLDTMRTARIYGEAAAGGVVPGVHVGHAARQVRDAFVARAPRKSTGSVGSKERSISEADLQTAQDYFREREANYLRTEALGLEIQRRVKAGERVLGNGKVLPKRGRSKIPESGNARKSDAIDDLVKRDPNAALVASILEKSGGSVDDLQKYAPLLGALGVGALKTVGAAVSVGARRVGQAAYSLKTAGRDLTGAAKYGAGKVRAAASGVKAGATGKGYSAGLESALSSGWKKGRAYGAHNYATAYEGGAKIGGAARNAAGAVRRNPLTAAAGTAAVGGAAYGAHQISKPPKQPKPRRPRV